MSPLALAGGQGRAERASQNRRRCGAQAAMPRRMSPAAQLALTIASVVVIIAGAVVWYTHYLQYVAR